MSDDVRHSSAEEIRRWVTADGDRTTAPTLPAPLADDPLARLSLELAGLARSNVDEAAAATRFVSRLAHEIRTPLASVLMLSELLASPSGESRHASRIGDAVREVQLVLERAVDLAKLRGRVRLPDVPRSIEEDEVAEWIAECGAAPGGPLRELHGPAGEVRITLEAFGMAARAAGVERPRVELEPDGFSVLVPGAVEAWLEPFSKVAPRGVGLALARAREGLRASGGDLDVARGADGDTKLVAVLPPR